MTNQPNHDRLHDRRVIAVCVRVSSGRHVEEQFRSVSRSLLHHREVDKLTPLQDGGSPLSATQTVTSEVTPVVEVIATPACAADLLTTNRTEFGVIRRP